MHAHTSTLIPSKLCAVPSALHNRSFSLKNNFTQLPINSSSSWWCVRYYCSFGGGTQSCTSWSTTALLYMKRSSTVLHKVQLWVPPPKKEECIALVPDYLLHTRFGRYHTRNFPLQNRETHFHRMWVYNKFVGGFPRQEDAGHAIAAGTVITSRYWNNDPIKRDETSEYVGSQKWEDVVGPARIYQVWPRTPSSES